MKKLLISIFLVSALSAQATSLIQIPKPEGYIKHIFSKVIECKWHISCYMGKNLGTSLYSITGSTLVSDLDTYIMQNDNALNAGKIENSTTTLPYLTGIGTITTGVWNGSIVPILYGGSATSTAIQTYGVVLGNGAYGLTVASTTGTSGQFLTSTGQGYPTWQTAPVTQTIDYNFTGTYFGVKNLYASSTVANPLVLNGVSYSFPTNQVASSSSLLTDSSGVLSWGFPTATTTSFTSSGTWIRPAGVSFVEVEMCGGGGGGGGTNSTASSIGGGGGSGAYARAIIQVNGNVTVTVGTGGVGGTGADNGDAGADSVFAGVVTLTAGGGNGGVQGDGANGAGGSGGSATNADFSISGYSGSAGATTLDGAARAAISGMGANSFWGNHTLGVANNSNGSTGNRCGGGSGANSDTSGNTHNGGTGGNGLVIVKWIGNR